MTVQPTMLRPASPRPAWQVVLGLLLPLPALVVLVTSYVEPTMWTIRTSFERFSGIRMVTGQDSAAGSVGFDNYEKAFDDGLGGALAYALGLAAVPLLVVLLLAPALAWAAHRAGRAARWTTRGALVLPLALFSPFGIAMAAWFAQRSQHWGYWLGSFGAFAAVAALAYLAALRTRRSPWPGVLIVGGLAFLAVFAVALQEFTYAWVFQLPAGQGVTAEQQAFDITFRTFNFNVGAAISTVVLVPLMVLGLLATLLVILTGLRLQVTQAEAAGPRPESRTVALAVGGPLLVVFLVITAAGLWPWLSNLAGGSPQGAPGTFVNTWIPPLISTVVGVTLAAVAAFGISGLRPLGRHSEWLLAPFGLFLFVGSAPLAIRAYAAGSTAGRLDSFLALVPPSRLTIPALFLLALFFRGQALRRETVLQENRPAPWWSIVLPVLPMLGLVYLATWVVQAQDLVWPLITSTGDYPTAQYVVAQARQYLDQHHAGYDQLLPIPIIILLLLAGVAAQLLYLERVALHAGLPERDHPPRT
jgi:ABC-type sugar transport system permease subunit